MAVRPLEDRVLVEVHDPEEKTAGGIVLPDTAKDKPQEGTVRAAGKGKLEKDGSRTPLVVREGDVVLFGKYSGSDVKISGKEYKIMRESDLLGKIVN
ncbi:MAG: co-chaperone GroES [Planctomycetes bacterium]|nr:co-chaperone GroES [Planctomycetota bacterium]